MVRYDKDGNCTICGLPGAGFTIEGVCLCLDNEPDEPDDPFFDEPWTDEDEAALEEYEEQKRRRIAEDNER